MRAAIDSPEHCAAGAAGPRHGSIHGVNAAQAGGAARVLHLPDLRRWGWSLGGGQAERDDEEQDKTHGWNYMHCIPPSRSHMRAQDHFARAQELLQETHTQ